MNWLDFTITQAFSVIIMLLQGDSANKLKWKAALVKVGKMIVAMFPNEFGAGAVVPPPTQ